MKKLIPLLLASLMSACSWLDFSGSDDEIEPAKLSDFNQRVELQRVWSTGIGDSVTDYLASLKPAVADGVVYAADHQGQITALDLNSGNKRWQIELQTGLSGGVGASSGLVVVADLEGRVFALDASDGSQRWQAKVSSEVLSSPVTNGEIVAVQSIDNKMFVFNADDGELLWRHDADLPVLTIRGSGQPLIAGNAIFSGFDGGKLIAFNVDNGSLLWETRLALPKGRTELERMVDIDGAAILVGDVLYAAGYQGRIGAISRGTGRSLWSQDGSSFSAPGHGQSQVYVTGAEDRVRALRAGSGSEIWINEQLFLRRVTGPVNFSGYVAVADGEGYLHLLDPQDGSFAGREKVDGSGVSVPLISAGELLIVQANDGSVSAYRVE